MSFTEILNNPESRSLVERIEELLNEDEATLVRIRTDLTRELLEKFGYEYRLGKESRITVSEDGRSQGTGYALSVKAKILNGEQLTASELEDLVRLSHMLSSIGIGFADVCYGEDSRYTSSVTTVLSVDGRLFAIVWESGLAEELPDLFEKQPVEVYARQRPRTGVETLYIAKAPNEQVASGIEWDLVLGGGLSLKSLTK